MIPNTLSPTDFRMMDKELSRKELSLPDKHIILFGAARIDDPIKGVEYLLQAIRLLIEKKQFPQEKLHLHYSARSNIRRNFSTPSPSATPIWDE